MKINAQPEGLNLRELKLATPPDGKRACGGACPVATCCRTTGKACCSAVQDMARAIPTLMTSSPELVSGPRKPGPEESQPSPQTPEL